MPQRPERAAVPPRSADKLTGAFFCAEKSLLQTAQAPRPRKKRAGAAVRPAHRLLRRTAALRARIIPSLPFDAEGTGFIRDVASFQIGKFSVSLIVREQADFV